MTKHVAVLMGGWSNERPVSLSSGAACVAALRQAGYAVTEIDVGRDIADVLQRLRPDVAFNALRGTLGESGMVQGVLELLAIPYTHSGILASGLAMDRHRAKIMFKAAGIPVTDHVILDRAAAARAHAMSPPYVIKRAADGASFAVLVVRGDQSYPPQEILGADWVGGEEIMVERYIPGRELACAVMGDVALGVTELVTDPASRNSGATRPAGGRRQIIPAQISPNIYEKVQKMSLKAHEVLGCRGVTRSEFRYNDQAGPDGELVCLEINTQPDMTPASVVLEQARYAGHSVEELVSWMVEDASCNR
ncbi:MAG: D-alanine--D-alanine ligase [Devosia sp.]|nr:D-alanine--D-alanine ligase [Devosia sp.]